MVRARARFFHKNVDPLPILREKKVLCPVCGEVAAESMSEHVESMDDPEHLALLIMES